MNVTIAITSFIDELREISETQDRSIRRLEQEKCLFNCGVLAKQCSSCKKQITLTSIISQDSHERLFQNCTPKCSKDKRRLTSGTIFEKCNYSFDYSRFFDKLLFDSTINTKSQNQKQLKRVIRKLEQLVTQIFSTANLAEYLLGSFDIGRGTERQILFLEVLPLREQGTDLFFQIYKTTVSGQMTLIPTLDLLCQFLQILDNLLPNGVTLKSGIPNCPIDFREQLVQPFEDP